jgi:UDP-N-acetylglucosamine 2-epimerase
MASLELYAGYKNGALYESTFKGKPCVVLMHDTDKENSADASINIYVYIGDKQLVQIDVLSLNGSLAAMLKDQDLWATIHSVSW